MSRAACATHATISAASASDSCGGRLRVADPHLDRAERRSAGAPTTTPACTRRSSACARGSRCTRANASPAAERVGHAAAREALGERLGARAVQPGVAPVEERRVRRDRQQQRQHRPQPVAHQHGPVGALDPHVDVQRERVVAPGDVLQAVLDAAVVVGVDDLLLAVVRPRMRAGRAERDRRAPRRARTAAGGGRAGRAMRVREVVAAAGADLDLRGDQLARDRLGQHRIVAPAASRSSSKRGARPSVAGVEQRELLLEPDGEVGRGVEGRARGCRGRGPRRAGDR